MESTAAWICVCGDDDRAYARELDARLQQRLEQAQFRADEVQFIGNANFSPVQGELLVSERELNIMRRLCQAWQVELRPMNITSHRKFIGPLIVGAKKLIYPLLQVLLKDVLKQQRDFNASAISMLGQLLQERGAHTSAAAQRLGRYSDSV
ncbi:MAG: hypothetical protein K1X79_08325 [Oligoflexia bacterium]|nr:hypothetical protein [Oligoflexia bacterium]